MTTNPWQPTLEGQLLRLRPLIEQDFEALHAVASDPLLWEQHPDRERHTLPRFKIYFESGIESRGALAIHDRATGELIGSSRFTGHDEAAKSVEVGYTFLARRYWGGGYNRELKKLMLDFAFQRVEKVLFFVGPLNLRSRRAMEKLGAVEDHEARGSEVYRMDKASWLRSSQS